jgi:pimeloyl-ACP methyl ester carboxylesterase
LLAAAWVSENFSLLRACVNKGEREGRGLRCTPTLQLVTLIAIIASMERVLYHEVRGTGEPLLLLRGTGGSVRAWDPVVERLSARRTVIAVDLPGFGTSPPLTPSGPPPVPTGIMRRTTSRSLSRPQK